MGSIQKANPSSWWVGITDKHKIKCRIHVPAGLTADECSSYILQHLIEEDRKQDEKTKRVPVRDMYFKKHRERMLEESSKLAQLRAEIRENEQSRPTQAYHTRKAEELQQIQTEIRTMRNNNGQIFMGGYTEPAKQSYDARESQIARMEKEKLEAHAKKWDESEESMKAFKKLLKEEEEEEQKRSSYSINGPGAPRVGGYAGAHAAAHGGGFNHPGVYAGGVWN